MVRFRTYKTHGIVLKQTPLGEADRILTLYTPDKGKLRVSARGVRRTKSKLGGHLEPLTHVRLSIAEGRSLDTISEADTIDSFRHLRGDLNRVSEALYLAELVESMSAEQSPNRPVFNLLLKALAWLETADSSGNGLRYFEVQLLKSSGFGPELFRCVECSVALDPGHHVFSCSKGGIVCPGCRTHSGEATLPLSLNAIKVLRHLQREPFEGATSLTVPVSILRELERVLRTYLHHVLERELKSAAFMTLVASTGLR